MDKEGLRVSETLNVSNRRWSASATSAEPAAVNRHLSALQGLNVALFNPCRGWEGGGHLPPVPLAYALSTDDYSRCAPPVLTLIFNNGVQQPFQKRGGSEKPNE